MVAKLNKLVRPDTVGTGPGHAKPVPFDGTVTQDSSDRFAPSAATAGPVNMLEKGAPLPRSIGMCADLYNDVRTLRLQMEKEVAEIQARETEVKDHIINNLSKSDDTGAAGKRYRAQIKLKDTPHATDWKLTWAYVAKHNRFDLLQKRLGEKAVMDMYEAGETIPGIEIMHVPTVSITKI